MVTWTDRFFTRVAVFQTSTFQIYEENFSLFTSGDEEEHVRFTLSLSMA